MDAQELLRNWPEWSKASAARVLASPAWRYIVRFGAETVPMTRRDGMPAETLALDVMLDGEPHVLALALSPRFPDLWRLHARLDALPKEVLLALIEKECGDVLQFVEDTFRRQLAVKGLGTASGEPMAFEVSLDSDPLVFSLDLSHEIELQLGRLDNLDADHASIRALTREATAVYGTIPLEDAEEAAPLAPGDFLLLPEDFGSQGRWEVEPAADDGLLIAAPEKGVLSFAQLADDDLPPLPEIAVYTLLRRGRPAATAESATVGVARALRILTVTT